MTEKTKLHIAWSHEKYQYQNIFFFSSEDKDLLDKVRIALNTNASVFEKEEGKFPGAMNRFMNNHRSEITGTYFFFRCLFETSTNNVIYEDVAKDLFEMFTNNSKAFLFTDHPNQYAKLMAEVVLRAPWMEDVEIIQSEIHLVEEDSLPRITL
jgi:hypothetical protein